MNLNATQRNHSFALMRPFLFVCFLMLSFSLSLAVTPVQQQLDTLVTAAQGKRIGLITNPAGCDEAGNPDVTYLLNAGVTISAFFAPEHGLRGDQPAGVAGADYIDPATGIPVYAVYGLRNAPTDSQLTNVDILVFDLQDVGVRFYTFVWTMTYCMEAAARNGKSFYVIDRPDPIGGMRVEGAANTSNYGLLGRVMAKASIGVATRHGMTAGELAWMWNEESMSPKVDLHIIPMTNWRRGQWWTETGRVFIKPSPNMRTTDCTTVYPGTCIFEGSNLSEGRGTDKPFEKIGAPFINATNWADALNALQLPGVRFDPITFTPTSSKFSGQLCRGVQVVVLDRDIHDPIKTGMHMLQTAWQLYGSSVTITSTAATLMGVPSLQSRIKTETVDALMAGWASGLAQFRELRRGYLLYPEESPSLKPPMAIVPAQMQLKWDAVKGRNYRLHYRGDLLTPWSVLNDYAATGTNLMGTDIMVSTNRFYRLELLP